MHVNYNFFRQYNDMKEIENYKEFYKSFSNDKEFGGIYSNFDHLVKNRFMNVFGFVNNAILRQNPKNILDVACGNGVNLPFSNLYPSIKYFGIDYAEKTVKAAKKTYPKAKVSAMDAFNLKFKKNTFDLVILSSMIILYEKESDRIKILEQVKKVLTKEGSLVLILWKDSFILRNAMFFSRILARLRGIPIPRDFCGLHFTESEAKDMVQKAGMTVTNADHAGVEFGILESVRYLNAKKYKRTFGKSEKESGKINSNTLQDLIDNSGTPWLCRIFYRISKVFPNWFAMFSVYIVKK